jgi:heterodisulfide reductase subunit D
LNKKNESKKNKVHFNLKEIISHNIEALAAKGVKNVIVNCAGCYRTISNDWPQLYQKELPFKVTHLTQFLADKVEKKEIKFKNWDKTITYHDPCHLGRHMGIFEDPRKIIEAIPEVKLIEMKNNRENAACCGAGGGLKAAFPNESLKIAELRIKEAMETKSDIIVTSCVFCKMNLTEAAQNLKSPLIVMNIEDIVMETLL